MKCYSCGSERQMKFPAEIAIHYPNLTDIDKPVVLLFPKLLICSHCGAAEFVVPEAELRALMNCRTDAGESK
jgi:hypothetical protein